MLPEAHVVDGALVSHAASRRPFRKPDPRRLPRAARLGEPAAGREAGGSRPTGVFIKRATSPPSPMSARASCLLYEDAQRMAALAVNRGSAAERLAIPRDAEIVVRRGRERARAPAACTCAAPTRPTSALAQLAIAGAPHGTLVTASVQTAGRGRQGRRWTAPAGSSLLMSLVLRGPPALLPLMAAVAVCDVAGRRRQIKWPNDIVLGAWRRPCQARRDTRRGAPSGGLGDPRNRAERRGANIEDLPAELRERTATLGRSSAEVEPTLERLLEALERRLLADAGATLDAWRARDALHGREIAWGAPDAREPSGRRSGTGNRRRRAADRGAARRRLESA